MYDSEMTWDVDKSVADVWLAMHHAVPEAVWWAVDGDVDRDVNGAVDVDRAIEVAVGDSGHPGLQAFLRSCGEVGEI